MTRQRSLNLLKDDDTFDIHDTYSSLGNPASGHVFLGGALVHCFLSFYVIFLPQTTLLLLTRLVTGLSAGILLASNGRAISSWRIGDDDAQVQVYISTIEIIINFLSFFALAEGIVIRFWRQLLRGTTVS